MIPTPVATTMNTSTFVEVTLGTQHAYGFKVLTSDGTAVTLAVDSAGTGASLIPADTIVEWDHYEASHSTVLWAKASAGTPDIILMPQKNH